MGVTWNEFHRAPSVECPRYGLAPVFRRIFCYLFLQREIIQRLSRSWPYPSNCNTKVTTSLFHRPRPFRFEKNDNTFVFNVHVSFFRVFLLRHSLSSLFICPNEVCCRERVISLLLVFSFVSIFNILFALFLFFFLISFSLC